MSLGELTQFLNNNGIQIGAEIEPEEINRMVAYWAQSPSPSITEILRNILYLKCPRFQRKLIKLYRPFFLSVNNSDQTKITPTFNWCAAEILAELECNPEYEFQGFIRKGESQEPRITSGEKFTINSLLSRNIISLTIEQIFKRNDIKDQDAYHQAEERIFYMIYQSYFACAYKSMSIMIGVFLQLISRTQMRDIDYINLISMLFIGSWATGRSLNFNDTLGRAGINGQPYMTALEFEEPKDNPQIGLYIYIKLKCINSIIQFALDTESKDETSYLTQLYDHHFTQLCFVDNASPKRAQEKTIICNYWIDSGRASFAMGDVTKSLSCFEKSLEISAQIDVDDKSPDSILVHKAYIISKVWCGKVCFAIGDWIGAYRYVNYQERDSTLLEKIGLEFETACYHSFSMLLSVRNADLSSAKKESQKLRALFDDLKPFYTNHPQYRLEYVLYLMNDVARLNQKAEFHKSLPIIVDAIEECSILEKLLLYPSQIPNFLSNLYLSAAIAHRHLEQFELSENSANSALGIIDQLPDSIRDVTKAKVCHAQALTYFEQSKFGLCLQALLLAIELLLKDELKDRIDLDIERTKLFLLVARLMSSGIIIPTKVLTDISSSISVYLERTSFVSADYNVVISIFRMFLSEWLKRQDLLDSVTLLKIVSMLFGRDLFGRIGASKSSLPEIETNHKNPLSPHKQSRHELNSSKDTLREALKNNMRHQLSNDELLAERNRNHYSTRYDALLENLAKHGKLSKEQLISSRLADFSYEHLCSLLGELDSLIIFLDLMLEIRSIDINEDINDQYAVIIDRDGPVLLIELHGMIEPYFLDSGDVHHDMDIKSDEKYQPVSLIWEKLSPHIHPSNGYIHIINSGRFHLLPLDRFKPESARLRFYPSLVCFAQTPSSEPNYDDCHYSTVLNTDDSLLLARYESDLMSKVWEGNGLHTTQLDIEDLLESQLDIPLKSLHLAGHGDLRFDALLQKIKSRIKVNQNAYIDDETILAYFPPVEVVWLSACSLAQLVDDVYNDPTGIIVPFLLNGSKHIVASLRPVPDMWMPLFVSMSEWIRKEQNVDIHQAIDTANKLLPVWNTAPEMESFKSLYLEWLKHSLGKLVQHYWQESGLPDTPNTASKMIVKLFMVQFSKSHSISPDFDSIEDETVSYYDAALAKIAGEFLLPPAEVCDIFRYDIRVYSRS